MFILFITLHDLFFVCAILQNSPFLRYFAKFTFPDVRQWADSMNNNNKTRMSSWFWQWGDLQVRPGLYLPRCIRAGIYHLGKSMFFCQGTCSGEVISSSVQIKIFLDAAELILKCMEGVWRNNLSKAGYAAGELLWSWYLKHETFKH